MLKFENFSESKKEGKDSFLKKTKRSPLGGAARTLALGAGLLFSPGVFAQNTQNTEDIFKQDKKMEDSAFKKNCKPGDYDLLKIDRLNLDNLEEKKTLDDDFMRKLSLSIIASRRIGRNMNDIKDMILEAGMDIHFTKEQLRDLKGDDSQAAKKYSEKIEKEIKKVNDYKKKLAELDIEKENIINLNFDESKIDYSDEEKEYLQLIPQLVADIESARRQVEDLVSSPGYLQELQEEFGCSAAEAKEHQKVRLSNLSLSNYSLLDRNGVRKVFRGENDNSEKFANGVLCYDAKYDNMIYFSYDFDYKKNGRDRLPEVATHEFLHKITRRNLGLSPKAIGLLKDSFDNDANVSEYGQYLNIPTERYVRLESLKIELEKLGVKKIGDKFTREHLYRMMQLYLENKLSNDAKEFISNTIHTTDEDDSQETDAEITEKYFDIYDKLFNEIASSDNFDKNSRTV